MSNILVVDDEKSVQAALTLILSDDGHNIHTAQNGYEALNQLADQQYDLVLADIRMPKMDGLQLLKAIRSTWGEKVPVIVITAYATPETAENAIRAGARDLILKPFEISMVRNAVNYVLKSHLAAKGARPEAPKTGTSGERPLAGAAAEPGSLAEGDNQVIPLLSRINRIVFEGFDFLQQVFDPERMLFMLFEKDPMDVLFQRVFSLAQGYSGEILERDRNILKLLAHRGQSLLIENLADDIQFQEDFNIGLGSVAAACFNFKATLTGVFFVYKNHAPDGLKPTTLQFLNLLADQIALTIENAVLSKKIKL